MNNYYKELEAQAEELKKQIDTINKNDADKQEAIINTIKKFSILTKEYIERLAEEQINYRATDINENIKVLLNEEKRNINDFLISDLIKQLDELKEILKIYKSSLETNINY